MDSIYLDYSSTTPMDLTVVDAMAECYRRVSGNPSSQHQLGRHAKRVLEDAAESIGNHLAARVRQPEAQRLHGGWLSLEEGLGQLVACS